MLGRKEGVCACLLGLLPVVWRELVTVQWRRADGCERAAHTFRSSSRSSAVSSSCIIMQRLLCSRFVRVRAGIRVHVAALPMTQSVALTQCTSQVPTDNAHLPPRRLQITDTSPSSSPVPALPTNSQLKPQTPQQNVRRKARRNHSNPPRGRRASKKAHRNRPHRAR